MSANPLFEPEPIPRGYWPDDERSREYEDYLNGVAEEEHRQSLDMTPVGYVEAVCVHCGAGLLVPEISGDPMCNRCRRAWGDE